MIIGYQIEDKNGWNWHDNISREDKPRTVLSEQTAILELQKARNKFPQDGYQMIAVVEGDIEYPIFEWSLSAAREQYKTLCVSAQHIPFKERIALNTLAEEAGCSMIMGRDTGWFIKLYEEPQANLGYDGLGDEFHNILVAATKSGYRMIEVDIDAPEHEEFPVFNDD